MRGRAAESGSPGSSLCSATHTVPRTEFITHPGPIMPCKGFARISGIMQCLTLHNQPVNIREYYPYYYSGPFDSVVIVGCSERSKYWFSPNFFIPFCAFSDSWNIGHGCPVSCW